MDYSATHYRILFFNPVNLVNPVYSLLRITIDPAWPKMEESRVLSAHRMVLSV